MTEQTKLPEFHGKPLIKIPKNIPRADFLREDFGKAVLEEYKGRASLDYENPSALNVLFYSNDVVVGSNPFAVVLVNSIIQEEGLRTATQADLEEISRLEVLSLKEYYEETALVLRTFKDSYKPNDYLAKHLISQLKARGIKELPIMIPLAGLELISDKNSHYQLAFNIKEDADIIYAPILNEEGCFNSENIDKKTGLPKKTGAGNRHLFAREDGLSVLYRDGGLALGAGDEVLVGSYSGGRVVVVSKNFSIRDED